MAELYLSRAQGAHGFEKVVVLKRILPQHAESEDFIRMFLTEARLAATLHHPNIVQVYDIGEEQNQHFFTMEYVQGQDLRKLVRAARKQQKPIPLEHILHIIMGVAAGLHHAHDKVGMDGKPLNIVHRDVSPSNVLVTYEGDIKIVDFGIAKAATAQVATIAGTLKGKIPYMSPEQCRGEGVDRRSDIFSIGTLLWELTTGKRLFAGDNEFAILNRVAKGDVPLPSSIRPDYPPELEAIVMRALQPEPDQRYTTAQDLQIDLEDFAREARLPVSSARMSRFMAELFVDEIRATAEEVSREQQPAMMQHGGGMQQGYAPQTPVAGTPMAAAGGTRMAAAPTNLEHDGHEYTPSELRQHGAATGPGATFGSDTTSSGTSGADVPLDEVPGKMRSGPLVAVAVGFAAALAVAGGIAWSMQRDDEAKQPESGEVQVIKSDSPAADEDEDEPEKSEQPEKPYVLDPAKADPSEVTPKLEDDATPENIADPGTPLPTDSASKTGSDAAKTDEPKAAKTSTKKPASAKKDPPPPRKSTPPKRPKKPKEEKKKDVNALPW